MQRSMGMGNLGAADVVFKRKFRWTFEVSDLGCDLPDIPPDFVKTANRPQLDIDETQIDYLHARTWIPGKGTWNELQVTYYDITSNANVGNAALLAWLRSVYDYGNPEELKMSSSRIGYTGTGTLTLYDGCGTPLEQWTLGDLWPKTINFGDLDYSSGDPVEIAVTFRYSQVKYTNMCGFNFNPCCKGC